MGPRSVNIIVLCAVENEVAMPTPSTCWKQKLQQRRWRRCTDFSHKPKLNPRDVPRWLNKISRSIYGNFMGGKAPKRNWLSSSHRLFSSQTPHSFHMRETSTVMCVTIQYFPNIWSAWPFLRSAVMHRQVFRCKTGKHDSKNHQWRLMEL